ncbi:nucleoside hydrolase [Microlunatus soli]|uniref:Inosine-uridine nucleoside N-ribohydrolase n=1 Tax=Microlunatus soli TaxID=630515 RepID=A0A1H2AD15_9ACTN|nr:nucleoside hydrolase [Microlunatus soli]SDT43895.1 Inosine-uridine nucleoside N-ribohydrolase [Microlunatus soli]
MERIILDVDLAMGAPGSDIDDGFALALALADSDIQLDLVTTVNGNTDAGTATALTLELLHRLERTDIPVHRGAERPLLRPQARQGSVPDDVEIRSPQPQPAPAAMVEHVLAHPGEITLVAVGPLTNVALALRLHRDFAGSLRRLVIMGGIFNGHTHSASMPGEFNIWNDPEAAQIVLESGVPTRWVGLDVTTQVQFTRSEAQTLAADQRPFAAFAGEYTVAWIDHLAESRTETDSCAMHDPLAVAAVTHPELLTWRDAYVQVETTDRSRGAMITDYLDVGWTPDGSTKSVSANAEVAVAVDIDGFHDHLLDHLKLL